MTVAAAISVIALVLGVILTALNIWDKLNTNKQKIKDDGKLEARRDVTFENDIAVIRSGNSSILVQLDKMDTKMDNFSERLIKVEISSDSAHKRIDKLETKTN